jgi:hypothetical protein
LHRSMSTLPFKVKSLFDYTSPHDEDLSFPNAQIITVTEEEDADWYYGAYTDASGTKKEGLFPRNFVEKYEPAPPPRPVRTNRPKKEPEAPVPPPITNEDDEDNDEGIPIVASPPIQMPSTKTETVQLPASPQSQSSKEAPPVEAFPAPSQPAAPNPKPAAPVSSKPAPPAVVEKPASGSFRDRIAAFNRPAAPPVAPFKPGGLGGSGGSAFIKKPFVAPPPSKDAYVPPPREQAQKLYRREEDPELSQPAEDDSVLSRAIPSLPASAPDDPDQPKPTSLKERIALLQKQQLEQAARHADAAQKKEKPKRPKQARGDSYDRAEGEEEDPRLEKINSADTIGADSTRPSKDEAETAPRTRRKSSRDTAASSGMLAHDNPSDANDADQSAAGETTEEAEDASTGRDDESRKPKAPGMAPAPPPRAPTAPVEQADVGDEEDDAEEEEAEEDDVDPEVRRRMEIRERMAKMSGGMGMAGMFGPPGGMPPMAAKKKKPAAESRSVSEYTEGPESPGAHGQAPPIPIIPMASKPPSRPSQPSSAPQNIEHEDEDGEQIVAGARSEDEIPDVEDVVQEPVESTHAPPPAPRSQPVPPTRHSRDSTLISSSSERAVPPVPPMHCRSPLHIKAISLMSQLNQSKNRRHWEITHSTMRRMCLMKRAPARDYLGDMMINREAFLHQFQRAPRVYQYAQVLGRHKPEQIAKHPGP